MSDYGHIVTGYGTGQQANVPIQDFIHSVWKGDRHVHIAKLVQDAGYAISVENLQSSGRNVQNNMWLSEESFVAMLASAMLYFEVKGH